MRSSPEEENWIPIDELLGVYLYGRRRIKIFYRNIATFAQHPLGCKLDDLAYVVRIHEYAHALDHYGASLVNDERVLNALLRGAPARPTAARRRSARYHSTTEAEKEWWAQAIAWAALQSLPHPEELSRVYLQLMEHQPPQYWLDTSLLTALTPEHLRSLRSAWASAEGLALPHSFSVREALEALLREIAGQDSAAIQELRQSLEGLSQTLNPPGTASVSYRGSPSNVLRLLVARSGPLQLRIYKVAETHPLPHFHLAHKAGESASYAIQDGTRLGGNISPKYEKAILGWAAEKRDYLMEVWKQVQSGQAPKPFTIVV